MKVKEMICAISAGKFDENLKKVYVLDSAVLKQRDRYVELLNTFGELFGFDRDVNIVSAPGRTEVCGNHTDHNNGKVLAASINLDAIAVVAKNDDNIIRVKSQGHRMNLVDLDELTPDENKFGDSTALVQGVAAGVKELGFDVKGFDACTTSDVMGGSGLSSSAAFEVLLGSILSYVYNDGKLAALILQRFHRRLKISFSANPAVFLTRWLLRSVHSLPSTLSLSKNLLSKS